MKGIMSSHSIQQITRFSKLEELKGVPQPFPYQGSKRYLANAILPLIPGDAKKIIEPFCGSAAVSIAARYTRRVSESVIGDVNFPLMELWNAILNDPDTLSTQYAQLWNMQLEDPKAFFFEVRDRFNNNPEPADFLYLLNRIVKGAIRYGKDGKFNQTADNRRLGAKPEIVSHRIHAVSTTLKGTKAIACDFEDIVAEATSSDIIYMDPPYQGTSENADHRYFASLSKSNFEEALARMNSKSLSYIVSYDVVDANRSYGNPLDGSLDLTHLHLAAGTSAQASLLGRTEQTVESLYLSKALVKRIGGEEKIPQLLSTSNSNEATLFE